MTDTGSQQGGSAAATQQMLQALKEARTRLEAAERAKSEPIAVIGLGCRFPGGATDADGFWSLLQNGVDAVIEVPQDRWNIDDYYDPDPNVPGKMYTRYGGFLQEPIDQFDPQFFGISPREAVGMDPQQRLLLEVSWAALEHAGLASDQLRRSHTGVFMGLCWDDYAERVRQSVSTNAADQYAGFGILRSVAVGRISYVLGLQGPNIQIDTACSSSLVAVHLACQCLRAQECDLALAGGVNLLISPQTTLGRCQSKTLAPDGRCKTFDAAADGYGQGEGCGVVVLKRLSDAQRDRDPILALVRGSAINHDGPSSGLTVPNEQAQEDLIRQALKNGKVKPEQIHYIEAHGTGTSLGDPIEVGALDAVFGASHSQASPLLIGSVKTNLGHLEGAAGIACFIKLVLALQREEIPPHLHFHTPNPHIDWDRLPIRVTTERTPWPRGDHPRLAGVSSFGISGTNAHLVLEEAPLQAPIHNPPERSHQLLTLSARSEAALEQLAGSYRQYLLTHPETLLADLCFTANTGRSLFQKRVGIVAASTSQMLEQLQAITQGETEIEGVAYRQAAVQRPRIAMLFTGQGSQYVGMGRELYETQPTFKQTLDQCAQILDAYLEQPLLRVIYADGDSPLSETSYTQPALFALEYSLAQVWMSWGIQPQILMGHSVGEYVAACIAGVFSLEDGLKLIAHRARLMQALSSDGAMVSALTDPDTVQTAISGYLDQVSIAAYNGPESVVFSGEKAAVEAVVRDLEAKGIKIKPLEVSQAFHSPLMDPILQQFEQVARQVKFAAPRIPIISNVSGNLASQEIATPEYWVNHVRQPVKFAQGMQALRQQGVGIYLEVGPKPILLGMGRQCLAEEQGIWLPSLRHDQTNWSQLLKSLAQLYVEGIKIDWKGFESGYTRCKISGLPTYPFERQRYWLDLPTQTHKLSARDPHPSELHPLLVQQLRTPLQDQVFETYFSPSQPVYLQDHCVFQKVIVPGAAYIEMALAAGRHLLKTSSLQVEDVVIQQALQLQPQAQRRAQMVFFPKGDGTYQFKIFSENQEQGIEPSWIEHASGYLKAAAPEHTSVNLHHLQDQCPESLPVQGYYTQLQANGLEYGPFFQGIQELWHSQTQALSRIELPAVLQSSATDYLLHPVLLDASMQTMGAALQHLAGSKLGQAYMPVGFESLVIYRPAGSGLWVQVEEVQARGQQGETLYARLNLWDEAGDLVARLVVAVRRVSRQQLQRSLQPDLSGWLYQQEWKVAPSTPLADHTSAEGHWLIFADQGGVGEKLAGHLQAAGGRCTLVYTHQEKTLSQAPDHFGLNPLEPSHYQQLLQGLPSGDLYRGMIHLWSLDEELSDWDVGEDILASQQRTCGSLLLWIQALTSAVWPTPPRLWILTQGAQSLDLDSSTPLQLKQAPLWGFARVLALENPDLQSVRIDLDPSSSDLSLLLVDLLHPDSEDQIAYREGQRFVARLARYAATAAQRSTELPVYPYRLSLPAYGVLDHLQLVAFSPTPPAPGEVQIQVRATGLNFRDVLTALGMMQEVLEQMGIKSAAEVPFGGECAGVITALGEGVTDLQVGDEVIAAQTLGSFASFVNVSADFVAAKPQTLTFAAAATLPVTFLTAYYGLVKCAQLQPGERVLIHAAAGGVGQAAVQIAQMIGAEVMGTASVGKWELLRSQGVEQIYNSRTLEYGEEIRRATGGEGVDVILNSLTGDYIPTNLKVLKQGGRFVEIGKLGIWGEEQMQAERADVAYFPFDLLEISAQDPHILQEMLRELMVCFREGQLRPLPHQTFPIQEVGDAFRVMAQAKHVGKVVVTHPAPDQPQEGPVVRQDGAYLITGGLGALGLQVARWLAEQGAQHLILTGRRSPSERAAQVIQQLQETGTQVQVVAADISRREDVQALIQAIQTQGMVLRGIVHAAGVLDDGVMTQQTWERFEKVMAPKVAGTWHLHQLTQDQPLDWFVCFSSMASLIGSPGQGNYAAANAFMDALAHYRRSQGLTATSLNWGPWAEAGMAASLSERDQDRLKEQGIWPIQIAEGMQLLEELLEQNVTQVGVLPIQWSRLAQQSTFSGGSSFLAAFLSALPPTAALKEAAPPATPVWQVRLNEAQPEDRSDLLATFIEEQVQKVLGIGKGQVLDPDRSFAEMGMDSLMAVELRNRLQSSLGSPIPSTVAFDYPTSTALAQFLAQDVLKFTSEDTADSATAAATESAMDSTLAELSQDEIARLLAQELDRIEESADHE
jgi:myxalamid-type polyketide synthase MxaB